MSRTTSNCRFFRSGPTFLSFEGVSGWYGSRAGADDLWVLLKLWGPRPDASCAPRRPPPGGSTRTGVSGATTFRDYSGPGTSVRVERWSTSIRRSPPILRTVSISATFRCGAPTGQTVWSKPLTISSGVSSGIGNLPRASRARSAYQSSGANHISLRSVTHGRSQRGLPHSTPLQVQILDHRGTDHTR